jgi:pimeloyl-ACP methyl ester carboxylesterase
LLDQIPGPVPAVAYSYGGAVITNAATNANNVVGLVYVAAFAPDEGEPLGAFTIDPDKFHEVFATDLSVEQTALMAATQRPLSELAFSEPTGVPAWKNLPSWAVVSTGDKVVGTDVVRSMAERAGATITEVEGSHVFMMSQPEIVTGVILMALAAVPRRRK